MTRPTASAAAPFNKFPEADHRWIASTASDDLGLDFEMHTAGHDKGDFLYAFSPDDAGRLEPWHVLATGIGVEMVKLSAGRGAMGELAIIEGPAKQFTSLTAALISIGARSSAQVLH